MTENVFHSCVLGMDNPSIQESMIQGFIQSFKERLKQQILDGIDETIDKTIENMVEPLTVSFQSMLSVNRDRLLVDVCLRDLRKSQEKMYKTETTTKLVKVS